VGVGVALGVADGEALGESDGDGDGLGAADGEVLAAAAVSACGGGVTEEPQPAHTPASSNARTCRLWIMKRAPSLA
jgi:hypothetical protein